MPDHEADLWREEMAADPAPMGALLRAAVADHCARTGESAARLCARCIPPVAPESLSRAYGRPNADPSLVRRVCAALGLRVALVPA